MSTEYEMIFDKTIHDEEDGLHLLDLMTLIREIYTKQNENFDDLDLSKQEYMPIIERIVTLLENRKNWIILFMLNDKTLSKYEQVKVIDNEKLEDYFKKLINHKILLDDYFINKKFHEIYPNCYYFFTNIIFQWNERLDLRWYYEFNKIYKKLTFDYDLCYSVRNHKKFRIELLSELHQLNNNRILLQRTNSLNDNTDDEFNKNHPNIKFNKVEGENDFSNLTWLTWHKLIHLDLFFRYLPNAKMILLDETWAWVDKDYNTQYLSEKTLGLILAGIPFISTHSYPLEIIEKVIDIEPHPFMLDFKRIKGNSKLISEFVEKFMLNFDDNFNLCKNWSDKCLEKMLFKIENENDFLFYLNSNPLFENKKQPLI